MQTPIEIPVDVQFYDEEARKFMGPDGLPRYAYEGDAGFDLNIILPVEERDVGKTIYPGERLIFESGLCIGMPGAYWGRIVHRSSTERRHRLRVIEGTIDSSYRGALRTQVVNDNSFPVTVQHGDRLSQIIFMPLVRGSFREVKELQKTERGSNGFGSSGYNKRSH